MKLLGCEILGTAVRTLAPLTNFHARLRTGSGKFRQVQVCPTKLVPSHERELPLKDEKQDGHKKTLLQMITFSLTGPDFQKKMYQMEIQLGYMVVHLSGTFPFTQTDLAEN